MSITQESSVSRAGFLKMTGAGLVSAVAVASMGGLSAARADEAAPLHVRVVYFSPTEGTKNAATALAEMFSTDVTPTDLTTFDARQEEVDLSDADLAIVAAPSYGGQIPRVEGLFTNLRGSDTPVVLVTAFGNRAVEDCFAQVDGILAPQGFVTVGAIGIVTPHVFSEKVGRSRPSVDDRAVMAEFVGKVTEKLAGGGAEAVALEGNPTPDPKELSVPEKQYNADKCTKCGLCAANCPVGAIDPETLEVNEDVCISCQRCTFVCEFNGRNFDNTPMREFLDNKLRVKQPVTYVI